MQGATISKPIPGDLLPVFFGEESRAQAPFVFPDDLSLTNTLSPLNSISVYELAGDSERMTSLTTTIVPSKRKWKTSHFVKISPFPHRGNNQCGDPISIPD